MAIQTESTYEVKIGLTTVDTIGLSNTLDTYTWDEIKDYNYVGSWTECYRQMSHRSPSNTTYIGYASTVGDCPFAASWYGGYTKFQISGYGTSLYNFDAAHGIYRKLILLNDSTDNYPTVITVNNRSNFKIITEFDAKKYALEYDAVKMLDSTFYSLYDGLTHQSLKYHTHLGQPDDDDSAVLISFRPYFIIEFENTYYCLRADIIAYRTMSASYLTNSGMAQCYNNLNDVTNTNSKMTGICEAMENWYSDTSLETAVSVPFIQNTNSNDTYYCSQEKYVIKIEFGVNNSGFLVDYAFKTEEDLLLFIAGTYGIHFIVNETIYKPIITENFVVGYTDQLDAVSDLDNYTDTKHDMPITPPEPTPPIPTEDAEPETFGWGGSEVHGMVRYYLLSQAEMDSLQSYMSNANWRMDYRNCVIGMYVVPNGGMFFDASIPTTLKFRIGLNESGGVIPPDEELDTGISCKRITGVVNNGSAVIEIPRMNGNFLDYEPYSKYMVYIPFCGVVPLPDYIAGKEIKVTIYPDVPTCTCTAVVSSESRKIATATGAFGSQLPLTSDGSGLKAASVINSLGNVLMGAGEVALGVGTGMVPLAIAGGAQMISSGLQTDLQLGQAFGYSIGASGDTSFFGAGNRCEYYIAYPKWNNPDGDDTNIYGHTYGFVVNKRGILGDFEGFTVCDNPHVSGFSCTSDEKDEIERLLSEGIIIHKPSE